MEEAETVNQGCEALRLILARSGVFMTTVNSSFSVMSTSSPSAAGFHSNSFTKFATKYSRWSSASPIPGQILRPAPNGIILISRPPVMSTPFPLPAFQKPFRPKLHRLLPHRPVPPYLRHREIHCRTFRNPIPLEFRLLRHRVWQHKVPRRVPPQPLQHHRLQIRHPLQVLLLHRSVLLDHTFDFFIQFRLHVGLLYEVGHDPLQRGGGRVGAGAQKLGAKADDLAVRQLPSAVLRNFEVDQRVDVRINEPVLLRPPPPLQQQIIPPRIDQRHERLLLLPPDFHELLPPAPEEQPGDLRIQGEDAEADEVGEEVPLQGLDPAYLLVGQPLAEAHEDEQAEHGELEALHDDDGCCCCTAAARFGSEISYEQVEGPPARGGVGAEARGVQELGGEVAAEGAPDGAVGGGVDAALVAGEDCAGAEGRGAVGELRAARDEGAVGEDAVGDEDGRAGGGQQLEGDDRAVPPAQAAEEPLDVEIRPAAEAEEREERADDGQRPRPRREGEGGGFARPRRFQEGRDEEG
ncbi:hypothetical protein ACMD2_11389 [Ananas comosus]|uniref:Uncharacterized protein n=1 Tax=Ananas comosus TaxID=4615 RepID=A0A199VP70_ANACO|nr:hypothetical protein ACMD2_11389 [Ananas comosus]